MTDEKRYGLHDLLYLMERLRKPDTGCPWDLEQNYLSITPSTLEEVYEVVDAIEREDYAHLKEELGDLFFQIVFYAQLAKEDDYFDFASIVDELTTKLVRRHPHVFPRGELYSEAPVENLSASDQVTVQWEQIKDLERRGKGYQKLLDDVPLALPSIQRAQKIQKRAAKVGMDWPTKGAVLEKLEEELMELTAAIQSGDDQQVNEELGDLMFSCVNLARHFKLDADQVLRTANNKFQRRIHAMEQTLQVDNRQWQDCSAEDLDRYWSLAKET